LTTASGIFTVHCSLFTQWGWRLKCLPKCKKCKM
jgi:hypothetical protein